MTDLVLSDVHLELPGACRGQSHVTLFSWAPIRAGGQNQPQESDPSGILVDEDGDLIMARRGEDGADIEALISALPGGTLAAEDGLGAATVDPQPPHVQIEITHHGATALADVGLQVWRGECLLADWLLHEAGTGGLDGVRTLLELGGGTGMATVVAAHCLSTASMAGACSSLWEPSSMIIEADPQTLTAPSEPVPTIFCTDHHFHSLETALCNLSTNSHVVSGGWRWGSLADDGSRQRELQGGGGHGPLCRFRTLDWLDFLSCDDSTSKSESAVRALLEEGEGLLLSGPGQPQNQYESPSQSRKKAFGWSKEDLSHLAKLDLIIAVS